MQVYVNARGRKLRPVARRSSRRERWARKNACRSGSSGRALVAGCVWWTPEHVCALCGHVWRVPCASTHARPAVAKCCDQLRKMFARAAELWCLLSYDMFLGV
eukprot:5911159-Prymnesium_polylepis.1